MDRQRERAYTGGRTGETDRVSITGSYTSDQNHSSMEKRLLAYKKRIQDLTMMVNSQQETIQRLKQLVDGIKTKVLRCQYCRRSVN